MPAYLREIIVGKCLCGKPTTHEVFNRFNHSHGRWCKSCGEKRVKELNAEGKAPAEEPARRRAR
jgi:hypothetical protein